MDKQHILDEIKRTAATNGGKPLVRDRFYKATGIKRSDWLDKIWACWRDRSAGEVYWLDARDGQVSNNGRSQNESSSRERLSLGQFISPFRI